MAGISRPFLAISLSPGAPCLLKSEQVVPGHEEIGQGSHDEQTIAVLLQAPIACLGKAEHPLDDQEVPFECHSGQTTFSWLPPVADEGLTVITA